MRRFVGDGDVESAFWPGGLMDIGRNYNSACATSNRTTKRDGNRERETAGRVHLDVGEVHSSKEAGVILVE